MDAGAVACVSFDINLSAAHCVTGSVSGASVNDDRALIHGVADRILRIGSDSDGAAVQISAQSIPRHTLDLDVFACRAGSDEPLSAAAFDLTVLLCAPDRFVQRFVIQAFCLNYPHFIPHLQTFFYGYPQERQLLLQPSS